MTPRGEGSASRASTHPPVRRKMLRYLLKTLLQMNLFSDTIRNSPNGTDPFFNGSLPSFNSSLLDWGNFTGFNGKRRMRVLGLPDTCPNREARSPLICLGSLPSKRL